MKACANPSCPERNPQPLSNFHHRANVRSGVESRCKTCVNVKVRERSHRRAKPNHERKAAPEVTKKFRRALSAKRYFITSAQNATPVHAGFFETLKRAAKHLKAEIVVIPYRYKNPTSRWEKNNQQDSEEWWTSDVEPYLYNGRKKLNANLVLAADVKIQPTASSPLSGFESLTGKESCIIGHPKMQMHPVPVPTGRMPKILTTTGTCTVKDYSDTKAGAIGAFHHYLGAILVEIDGGTFHLRQINADRVTGAFIDLDTEYTVDGAKKAPRALALAMGDAHAKFMCPKVDRATFGPGGIIETLDPEALVWHDVFDGYAPNPHHLGNPFIAQAKYQTGFGDVNAEVEETVAFIAKRTKGRRSFIVSSNHDNFLSRWVIREDWKRDPENAEFYLETALAMLRSVEMTPGGTQYADPFKHWVEKLKGDADIQPAPDNFKIADIECGMHGDKGPNGARGSLKNLSRLGCKVISGHTHTPGIEEGHYQVGTSTPLRLEYSMGGPSSWLNAHCVVYANSKRALLIIVDGAWRA